MPGGMVKHYQGNTLPTRVECCTDSDHTPPQTRHVFAVDNPMTTIMLSQGASTSTPCTVDTTQENPFHQRGFTCVHTNTSRVCVSPPHMVTPKGTHSVPLGGWQNTTNARMCD